ncbi:MULTISPECIES: Imm6 family immunity protein [unclassified Pseudomonas]|uniref:Imm6 family immunity protein n=1 Tax=unclassified Pseudomonas TaxID=196821 RepID=UPI0008714EE1|nr:MULTISPECIES: Imm6 family immunity protein [unclassified Pseudomonas]SCW81799.1 Immunity protein Imm6 [Pseudomonas sp. NFACC05-1]SFL41647.1 Immunity protein Imm6 [Pseudomonas sp. NFACC46-3]
MGNKEALKVIVSMMWVKKASIFLLLLDYALRNLDSAGGTQEKCQEAVDRCWLWLSNREVSAGELASYLDSEEMQSGPLAEENFASESVEQNSLILILLVVGFFANKAYKVAGLQEQMSESICEADESSTVYIVDYIGRIGLSGVLSVYLSAEAEL